MPALWRHDLLGGRAPELLLSLTVLMIATLPGCRPAETPKFTPSAEVLALTDDLEDESEIKTYKDLQKQIADVLQERCGTASAPRLLGDDRADRDRLVHGYELFTRYCVQCHGVNGDGRGVLADHLHPAPRDYTQGVFKFSSTSNGKPRKADLIRTVRRGVTGTSMPSFENFSDDDLNDVVDYVLALSRRGQLQKALAQIAYDDEELPDKAGIDEVAEEILAPWVAANRSVVMPLTPMPPMTEETVAQGHALFLKFACSRCHGVDGRGGSLGGLDVGTDVWGHKAAAADLTSGMFHGGSRPIDVYRRIYAGITGTPMPGFAGQFSNTPDDIWLLVHFIEETGQRRRRHLPPLEVPAAEAAGQPAPASESTTPKAAEEEATPETEDAAKEAA